MRNTKCIQVVFMCIVNTLLVVFSSSVSAKTMKIAVPATASEKYSPISQETGRAPYFLFFDDKGYFLEAIRNPAREQPGGVSRTVVALLVDNDVTIIIAESVGDKMKRSLIDHHIKFVNKTGMAHKAVEAFIQH